ncbi:MAG TPA: VWA domain-containing protein [Terracidiphilus sp.]|nr:VWA domain-containing protein [Terracidiphilus sp.]
MRIRTTAYLLSAFFLSFFALFPAAARQPAAAQQQAAAEAAPPSASVPTFKVQAREVLLPVTVRDKHGNLVPNLTPADFILTEDGRPQTIKSFSQHSDLPFLLGLEVDTSRSVIGAIASERKAAEKFVELMLPADPRQAKAGDQAFLIHFDREVELLEDFTNSRDKLDRELEEMGPTSSERSSSGPETSDSGGYGRQAGERPAHGGTQLYDAIYLASNELMKPREGRKALIVFSDGVDRSSKMTQSEAIDAAERANVSVYTIYFRGGEEPNEGNPGMRRRGGWGYPGGYPGGGYPGGGYPGGGYPGGGGGGREQRAPIDGRKVMQDIASRTGGQFFEAKHSDNLADIYNMIATDLRGQYLLTYTPDQVDNDGGYHRIALKAKKDGLTVITREGYYAPGGDSK